MLSIYTNYCTGPSAVARILTIYIEEAHASDEWALPESQVETTFKTSIRAHRSIDERIAAAKIFESLPKGVAGSLEIVCDSMEGDISTRYGAWPERLYIILDGVIVYKGGQGPFDYRLWEVQEWLYEKYGKRGESLRR